MPTKKKETKKIETVDPEVMTEPTPKAPDPDKIPEPVLLVPPPNRGARRTRRSDRLLNIPDFPYDSFLVLELPQPPTETMAKVGKEFMDLVSMIYRKTGRSYAQITTDIARFVNSHIQIVDGDDTLTEEDW